MKKGKDAPLSTHLQQAFFLSSLLIQCSELGGSGGLFYLELAGERCILKPSRTQTVWPERVARQTDTNARLLNVTHSDSWNRVCKLIDSEAALKVAEWPATKTGSPVPVTLEIQFWYSDYIFSPFLFFTFLVSFMQWKTKIATVLVLLQIKLSADCVFILLLFRFKNYWASYVDRIFRASSRQNPSVFYQH